MKGKFEIKIKKLKLNFKCLKSLPRLWQNRQFLKFKITNLPSGLKANYFRTARKRSFFSKVNFDVECHFDKAPVNF